MNITPIAHIENDFRQKFGIPRQSGLTPHLRSRIVFEPEFAKPEALRGIDGFSHLWLIWEFSEAKRKGTVEGAERMSNSERCDWKPTVRPPRLGGNERMGVFATRSPFRPNSLGLSVVELECVDLEAKEGPVLVVGGADLMDGTPIYDIKPYIPYADSCPEARGGFTEQEPRRVLEVRIPENLAVEIPEEKQMALREILSQDPRPAYHDDSERVYVMAFGEWDVSFRVSEGVVEVTEACINPRSCVR